MDFDTPQLWRKQIERRLNEIGSRVRGSQEFTADRISDLIEQIDELRREVATLHESLEKARVAFAELKKNGGAK